MSLTELLRLLMRWRMKLPDVKKKKPSCTFSTALLPPPSTLVPRSLPFYLISLSLALSLCLSLRSHTQMHTRRKAVKTREGNGSGTMGIFCLRGRWGIRSTATESVRARVWVWVRVWECVGVRVWVSDTVPRKGKSEKSGWRGIGLWRNIAPLDEGKLMCNNYYN